MGVCYAISEDGISWEKPELGLVEFQGSKANNIVLRGPHGAGIRRDKRETDPQRRFKAFFRGRDQMCVAFSRDGFHWSDPILCPEIQARGDTHNNWLWAPELGRYVGFTRLWDRKEGVRLVGRTESADFLNWTRAEEVLRGEGPDRQTYAMIVFRYASLYLGLLMVLNRDEDTVDCELAVSVDTIRWERICTGTPLIPRGPEGSYDWGCVFAAAYPVVRKDGIRLYYAGSDGRHSDWRRGFFCLAHLRPDGFAGLEPIGEEVTGTVLTAPIECAGRRLLLSADVFNGSVRAAIAGADGFGLENCKPILSSVAGEAVVWDGGGDLSKFVGKRVQLLFELRSARLYAFGFSD